MTDPTAPSEQDEQDLINANLEAIEGAWAFSDVVLKAISIEELEEYDIPDHVKVVAGMAVADAIRPHLESRAASALAQRDAEIAEMKASRGYFPAGVPTFTVVWVNPEIDQNGDDHPGYWEATCEQTSKWNDLGHRMDIDDSAEGKTPVEALEAALRYCKQIEDESYEEFESLPDCPTCAGSGYLSEPLEECEHCKGYGKQMPSDLTDAEPEEAG